MENNCCTYLPGTQPVKPEPLRSFPLPHVSRTSPHRLPPRSGSLDVPPRSGSLDVPKLSLLERRDVKRVKPIRPIPTYMSDSGYDFLSSPISPTLALHSPLSKMGVSSTRSPKISSSAAVPSHLRSPHAPSSAPAFPVAETVFSFPPPSAAQILGFNPPTLLAPIPLPSRRLEKHTIPFPRLLG